MQGGAWCLIFIINLYTKVVPQWLPLVKGGGTWMFGGWQHGMGMLVVHHGMKNAFGGNAMIFAVNQNLRITAFFWLLCQNIGHIFCTRFCMAVNDNQVIWPAYNFFQQFFHWPFIMICLKLELLWNKHILYKFLFTFLKIEGLVVYSFPNLVLRLIFDRGGTPFVGFFISQYDFGLGGEGFF